MTVFVAALISVFTASVVSVPDGFEPVDCSDVYNSGETVSGIYTTYPAGDVPVWVYCHMVSEISMKICNRCKVGLLDF